MNNNKEIVLYESGVEGEKRKPYFLRETVIKTHFSKDMLPVTNSLAWIEDIDTGDSLTVPHEYLVFVSPNNEHKELFYEIIQKIKNKKNGRKN